MFHHHHDHDHAHGHDHGHAHEHPPARRSSLAFRLSAAAVVLAIGVAAACLVQVRAGEATVVTRFGDPKRVLVEPGLSWRLPTPIESTIPVDLRLRTTSSGLMDVGTKDGLRVIAKAYVAWAVPTEAEPVRRFLRAVRNKPDEAAQQIRTFTASALQITASSFELSQLINTDASKVQIAQFEERLKAQIEPQLRDVYGVTVLQVGLERLSLPAATLNATVERMRAERETVAAERMAEGTRRAAEIRSDAERDARIARADASVKAAGIEAGSRQEAAQIYAKAYAGNPKLYTLLRSLDTLQQVVGPKTSLVLRTDAAPFRAFVDGPVGAGIGEAPR